MAAGISNNDRTIANDTPPVINLELLMENLNIPLYY
jgi:hypothetical protein